VLPLSRRPARHVPRHSTRGPVPGRPAEPAQPVEVLVDLGAATPPREVLVSVLEGLRGGPERAPRQA
jgi:hypothetical protein